MVLDKVKRALVYNEKAYDTIRGVLQAGMTEKQLLAEIEATYLRCAGQQINYIYDLVSGERSGAISGEATERQIQAGDCVIADLLPCCEGNWCDTTRTFFVGTPSETVCKAYQAVLQAIRRGEECLKAGAVAGDIYEAVNASLTEQGFGPLVHHAGHAVGDTEMDEPDFVQGATGRLATGMVVTLEPGIYFDGENGIRVENNYRITEDGFELLFQYPEDLEYFIVGGSAHVGSSMD